MEVAWFGASYEFFHVLLVVYRCLGLPAANLIEVDDTLDDIPVHRFKFASLIPGTRGWWEAREIVRKATAIYAKNEMQGLLCIVYFGGIRALRKTTVVVHTALSMPPGTRGVWRFMHDRIYRNPLYRYLLNHARAIHGASSSVYTDLKYVGVEQSHVSFIGSPVWLPEGTTPSRPETFTVAFAARFTEQKGIDFLIDVANRLAKDRIKIVAAGGGPLRDDVVAAAQKFSDFEYVGVLPSVTSLFAGSCAVLVPSRWEGVGTVCAEAFFAGIPPVAFDIAGNRDIFETALLPELMVTQFDVVAMVDKLRSLHHEWLEDRDVYFRKFAAAGERVRARYDADSVFSDTLEDMKLLQAAKSQ